MRTNLPVTQREYSFAQDMTLMSTTDTQSHIVYANAAFVEVSGFPYEEIVGQPHKNRRQNGDHYRVRANATPNGYRDISQRGKGQSTRISKKLVCLS